MKQECDHISCIRLGVLVSDYSLTVVRFETPYHEGAVLRPHLVSGYSGVSSGANSGQAANGAEEIRPQRHVVS